MALDPRTGTVIDTEYTFNAFPEMFPRHLAEIGAALGQQTRLQDLDGGFDYCELGCGNGLGCNVMAAANPGGRFVGVDLNPAHIANAQALASAGALSNVRFLEASFASLMDRDDLPQFDVIALHGVYSWVGAAQRAEVVAVIGRFLRPGGVVYLSYNALPGWADLMPVRKLMIEQTAGLALSSLQKADYALEFLQRIASLGTGYFAEGTRVPGFIRGLDQRSPEYLVHEYLNADWQPHHFADVAREMAGAGLTFIGDAVMAENRLDHVLDGAGRSFVAAAPDVIAAQTWRDYLTNRHFRRDIFVKGDGIAGAPFALPPSAAPEAGEGEGIDLGPFNRAVCQFAFNRQTGGYLAARATGSTQRFGWIEAGLLLAWDQQGFDAAPGWCARELLERGQRLIRQGREMESLAEHEAYLCGGLAHLVENNLGDLLRTGILRLARACARDDEP